MIELGFIQGIARDKGELLQSPVTGRTCVEYRVVVTVTRTRFDPPVPLEVPREEVIHVASGFTPWVLQDVRSSYAPFESTLVEALSAYGDGNGGFDVCTPLAERAQTASAQEWRLTSGYPSRLRRAAVAVSLGALGITVGLPFVFSALVTRQHRDDLRTACRYLWSEIWGTDERFLRKLGRGGDLDASRARRAADATSGFAYGITEHVVRPGDRVDVFGATAVTRATSSDDYRSAGVRRGLVASG